MSETGRLLEARVEAIVANNPRAIAIGPFGSALKSDQYTDTGVPLLRGQDITVGDALNREGRVFVPEDVAAKFPACLVSQGDLVFPHRGAIGRVGIVGEEEWLLSSSMMKLSVDRERFDPKYVFYYFRGPGKRQLLERASTVGTPGIGQPLASLKSVVIRFPELAQQRAIAEVLGALDDKIAANTRLTTTAADLMIARAYSGDGLCTLGEVASRAKKSIRPEGLGTAEVDHFSLPAYDDGQSPEVVPADSIKSNKFAIEQPSVLLSKLNPRIPRIWDIVEPSERPSLSSTEFIVLHPDQVSSSVLWAALSHPNFISGMKGMVAGTSGSHQRVRPDDVMALEIIDPRSLSDNTHGAITALGRTVAHARLENASLSKTRDALLPLLMSGKVTVKDAESVVEGVA